MASGIPVALFRILLGICIIEFHMVCVPGSLVAKLAKKAAGLQVGFRLKCRMPANDQTGQANNLDYTIAM